MLQALFDFYYDLFYVEFMGGATFTDIEYQFGYMNFVIDVQTYFAITCSVITLIIILVVCWLFVYKIIRLIGGLIR